MRTLKIICPLLLLSFILHSSSLFADSYTIDLEHSSVSFKVRHLLSKVRGQFNDFTGTIEYDPNNPQTWSTEAIIQAGSIDTNVKERDKHLQSPDFFDVEKYPTLAFKSTSITDLQDGNAKLNGDLTIHGITRPVTFDLEALGVATDPWGNVRAAFTANAKINRKDFGLSWNEALESGQLLVGEEVEINLEIEAIKQT